ncbi:uncharacterized protein LOC141914238 [Tubulanus polymorphus]|uniref:uncharacterized protein LOC141914238 n=1 Tax=Tubulanus polymorphus TaxID=672921 RepID=UPI003DA4332C
MGHQGSTAKFPCLWCQVKLDDLRKHHGSPHCPQSVKFESRSVALYKQNVANPGANNLSVVKAQMFHLQDIDHLVPPGLHISLGLGLLFFNMLEKKCQEFDNESLGERDETLYRTWQEISTKTSEVQEELNDLSSRIDTKCKYLQKLTTANRRGRCVVSCTSKICLIRTIENPNPNRYIYCIKCDAPYHEQCIEDCPDFQCELCLTGKQLSANKIIRCITENLANLKYRQVELKKEFQKKSSELNAVYSKVQAQMGPLCKTLNQVLIEIGVDRQAYHSNSFVGNHIHKLLNNAEKLCKVIPDESISSLFQELFERLRSLYRLYSASRFLSKDEISNMTTQCHDFGRFFTSKFPNVNITPKIHILVYHVPEFVNMWGTLGLFSEQALESKHASVNRDNRTFCSIRDNVLRSKLLFQNQALYATKTLEQPASVPRKCSCGGFYKKCLADGKSVKKCKSCQKIAE